MKDSRVWNGPILEKLVEDCIPLVIILYPMEGPHGTGGEGYKKEEAAKKIIFEPMATSILNL